ncbi:13836_t:CDS:2, partial [Gigaspora rosea]
KDMVEQFRILAKEGEILFEDVPEIKKVIPLEISTKESDTTRNFNKFQETKKRNNKKGEKIGYNTTIIAK